MSKITKRDTAPRDGASIEDRLARLLDAPFLARVVPHLPTETLHQLIRHCGLHACGELVTSATPAQLTSLLDLDLWRPARPGRDGQLDVDRFGEWLEVLVDTGESVAARTVAGLDEHLVVAGLSRYLRVFDPGIFEPTAQSDDEAGERHEAMREGDVLSVDETGRPVDAPIQDSSVTRLECEVGGYIVRARRTDSWDAIVDLLAALEAGHSRYFHAVMRGCRRLSNSRPEVDGLDDLLLAPEQQLHDVAIERERRRAQQGYAAPADARAFLQMARQPRDVRSDAETGPIDVNPIVKAYFQDVDDAQEPTDETARTPERGAGTNDVPASIAGVIELLTEAGMMPERPRPLLEAPDAGARTAGLTRLSQLMAFVRDTSDEVYFARRRELAFLANILLAGCSVQSRPFTPREASDAAASVCNLGLEYWPSRWPRETTPQQRSSLPDAFLIDRDLVTAFEVGWSVLHQDVSVFVARQLISMLDDLHSVDPDIERGLAAMRRKLAQHTDAPWLARDAAEVLGMLDMTAWISVIGLLDECPVVPETLTAILEGRRTTVSPTAFGFISTAAQVGDIRVFMRRLLDVLSR